MKKVLAIGLGVILVVGSATTAPAASQIDFSGYYRMYFGSAWNNAYTNSDSTTNDSGFHNRLEMVVGFHATDEVSVFWRLRAPNQQRWGAGDANNLSVITDYVYGRVKQDWGNFYIGRLGPTFGWPGLFNLGWMQTGPDDNHTLLLPFVLWNNSQDGIRWENRWDNGFKILTQFNRLGFANNGDTDSSDFFWVEGAKTWDDGGAAMGLMFLRDGAPGGQPRTESALKAYFIQPSFVQRFGNFSVHATAKAGWGKIDDSPGTPEKKFSGYGAYLDFDYNYGPGNINLAGWWTSGDDGANNDKRKDFVGMGNAYSPLVVAYGSNILPRIRAANAVALANNNAGAGDLAYGHGTGGLHSTGFNSPSDQGNHWAINLNGNHSFTDDFRLTWAVAYLALSKVREGAKKDIGIETDLGFQFKLLDNLEWRSTFGYLFTGKAFDGFQGSGLGRPTGYSVADAYSWYNTLTFRF